jgi:hypothetical protein
MKHIKLFEGFNTDDDVAGALNEAITGTAESFLDNESEELNKALGVATPPTWYKSVKPQDKAGRVTTEEVDFIVDAFDPPMNVTDTHFVKDWIKEGDPFDFDTPPQKQFGPLQDRIFQGADKKWYPAIESLRALYNRDESFETLGSRTKDSLLKGNIREDLIEVYQHWLDCVNNNKRSEGNLIINRK